MLLIDNWFSVKMVKMCYEFMGLLFVTYFMKLYNNYI